MKKCPYCAEEIQDEAIVCRYCGRDILNQKPQLITVQEKKLGFWDKVKIEGQKQVELKRKQEQDLKERLAQYDKDGIVYCPKCYSTSLSTNKKGFGLGKAIVGTALVGPVGLLAGGIGAQKIKVTCIKCGHQFWAGKR